MSNYWEIKCSCGESTPDGGVRDDGLLRTILAARPQIEALVATGVTFAIDASYGYDFRIHGEWFVTHRGPGHVVFLEDEHACVDRCGL